MEEEDLVLLNVKEREKKEEEARKNAAFCLTIKQFLQSPTVLYRAPFLVPVLVGKSRGSIAWMFWWCSVGIGIFGRFRERITSDASKRLRKLHGDSKSIKTSGVDSNHPDSSLVDAVVVVQQKSADGSVYDGELWNNKKHGKGSIVPSCLGCTSMMTSGFRAGKMTYGNGSSYDGSWKQDKYHGAGKYIFADKSFYEGEWREGVAEGKGTRKTKLENKFEGIFRGGRPYNGIWTSPSGIKKPFTQKEVHDEWAAPTAPAVTTWQALFVLALNMYAHVVLGLLLCYWIGYLKIWIFNIDMILLIPIIELVVFMEYLLPRMKAMIPQATYYPTTSGKSSEWSSIKPDLLEELKLQSQNDVINLDFEWMNYTLAQFWHTYEPWAGEYIRSWIERFTGNIAFLQLESPITVTQLKSVPRNDDPKLREERAQECETSDEDLIIDLYINLDWCSDVKIKMKLFNLLPISIEDIFLQAPIRVVLQWVALDHNDPLLFPNLAYLGLESVGRAELTLSLKLFGFFDVFSIPPFSTLLQQDYLLDLLFDVLGPETGFWLDFIRGRPCGPFPIINDVQGSKDRAKALRKQAGDVKGLKEAALDTKLQITLTVLSAEIKFSCTPYCVLRLGSKSEISAAKAPAIEKQTKIANKGTLVQWNAEMFSWFGSAAKDVAKEDWIRVKLIDSSRWTGSKTEVGSWEMRLSEMIHTYELVPNGPTKTIECTLSAPVVPGKKQQEGNPAKVYVEVSLSSLGLSEAPEVSNGGKSISEFALERGSPGVIHIQLKDCQNLHRKMNKKLNTDKIEPYVTFFVGAKQDFDSYFRTDKGDNLGLSAIIKGNAQYRSMFHSIQTKAIPPGYEVVWSDNDGRVIFDKDIPAAEACIMAEVYHKELLLGFTFLEVKDLVLDVTSNKFVLKEEDMIQILAGRDNQVVRGNGEKIAKHHWQRKPFETLANLEIPLMTMYVSFAPKLHSRPTLKVTIMRTEGLPNKGWLSGKASPYVVVALTKARTPSQRFQTGVMSNTSEPIWTENNTFSLIVSSENNMREQEQLNLVCMDHNMLTSPTEIGSWIDTVANLHQKYCSVSNSNVSDVQKLELVFERNKVGDLYCKFCFQGDWST